MATLKDLPISSLTDSNPSLLKTESPRNHALREHLVTQIQQTGPLTFASFMEQALYHPTLGYYMIENPLGRRGDFTTAPELSSLFSHCLANQCAQILSTLGEGSIVEIGAGSGMMAVGILQTLAQMQRLPQTYYILEISPHLKKCQHALFQQQLPWFLEHIEWVEAVPKHFTGIILGNEVLDALPVHRFSLTREQTIQEGYVDYQDRQFHWYFASPQQEALTHAVRALSIELLPEDSCYISEINLGLPQWLASMASHLHRGVMLFIDYGFPRSVYYHPDRSQGTLMCYRHHLAQSNPLINVGTQDISAHVDFTLVAEAADTAGLRVAGFTTQATFLLNCGLLEQPNTVDVTGLHQYSLAQQIKRLTLPTEMGELYKVIALTRNYDPPLLGFSHFNQVERL